MPVYQDQLGRTITMAGPPQRIVSLVPSQTELLHYLGLEKEVVGITKFCMHPQEWFRNKTRVGGTKNINLQKVKSLQPDLILANKEENVQEQIEELAKEFPVWVSDVNTLNDALGMIESVGTLVAKADNASILLEQLTSGFESLKPERQNSHAQTKNRKPKTAYFVWKDPYMTAGGDTFISDLLNRAGFLNIFQDHNRYPVVTTEQLQAADCEVLLLSSEPYPFGPKHLHELQAHLPHIKILLVDGELFSWYGSRLLYAPAYFKTLRQLVAAAT